jgi:hypothetical protein
MIFHTYVMAYERSYIFKWSLLDTDFDMPVVNASI